MKNLLKQISLGLATALLIAPAAVAQNAPSSASSTSAPAKPVVATAREAGSGMATGRKAQAAAASGVQRKDGSIVHADFPKSADERKGSGTGGRDGGADAAAHATARSGSSNKTTTGANPLYQGNGASGTNPLYESGRRMANRPNASGSGVVEYKDGEDMTTRYRPGNNKTTAAQQGSDTSSGSSSAAHATAKDPGFPACDAAAKDAAKCAPAPPPAAAQAAKHANKIDGFTVKQ